MHTPKCNWVKSFQLAVLALLCSSCATGKLYNNVGSNPVIPARAETPDYTLYLIGDTGEQNEQFASVMRELAKIANDDVHPGSVLFLGDNIYPSGLAEESDKEERIYGEDIIRSQVISLSPYKGDLIYIPGNHDWDEGKPGGLSAIRRQGEFIKSFNDKRIQLLPENGCGGPVVKELNEHVVLFIIDSQWWIQDWDKEDGINEGCSIKSREEFISRFRELRKQYNDRQQLIAMHHPPLSYGPHGGKFTFQDHLFPLTKVVDWLYIPLPVIGSIYPWYRQIIGHPQDQTGKELKRLRPIILEKNTSFGQLVGKPIILAGHDHNLQYLDIPEHHYVNGKMAFAPDSHPVGSILVSGSGSKENAIANGRYLNWGHRAPGFMQLDFYPDRGIILTVYEVSDIQAGAVPALRQRIQ